MTNVYFIKGSGRVKIGRSTDVSARLAQLQTGCADSLTIEAILPDVDEAVETYFHTALAEYRERGEWFTATPVTLALMAHIRAGARLDTPASIAYYKGVPPSVPMHPNAHVDVRLMYKLAGDGALDRMALRDAEYAAAVRSYRHRLARREKAV